MIPLPDYIDPEAWAAFVQMRREIKKPLTQRAAMMILRDLEEIRAKGHNPNDALDQSTLCCWRGVWPMKPREIEAVKKSDYEATQARLQAEAERQIAPPPARVLAMVSRKRKAA
jgi:hypothetical protein